MEPKSLSARLPKLRPSILVGLPWASVASTARIREKSSKTTFSPFRRTVSSQWSVFSRVSSREKSLNW